jgi:hypothetical protein
MVSMSDSELEQFKSEVNLVDLAAWYGYELIRKESSRASAVMAHPDGDKVVIATAPDGHGIFFSVRKDRCSGSVVDFVMHRESASLGVARLVLRRFMGIGTPQSQVRFKPEVITATMPALYAQWLRMNPYPPAPGYLEYRGLASSTIAAFSDRIRIDGRGNVVFRHDDLHSLCGWELKNRGFTGFSGGGRKALFAARIGIAARASVPLVVISESAIDVMSYYQLKPLPGAYLSFAGAIAAGQQELLAWIVNRYPEAQVIAATDNDVPGERYASQLCQIRAGVVRDCPPIGKDWNDTLNGRSARPV